MKKGLDAFKLKLVALIVINLIFRNVNSSTGKYSFFSLISGHNIFLTLAVLFVFIWCLENIKERKKIIPNCLLAIITALSACILEGGLYLLPVALILWLFRNRKPLQCAGIALWSTALLVHTLLSYNSGYAGDTLYGYLCFDNKWAMFTVIFFILLYNGERGRNTTFTKYMFYIIYPVHLWILMILRFMIISAGA